jgi:hypothetical protein
MGNFGLSITTINSELNVPENRKPTSTVSVVKKTSLQSKFVKKKNFGKGKPVPKGAASSVSTMISMETRSNS